MGQRTVFTSLSQFDMTLPGQMMRIRGYARLRSRASLMRFLSVEFPFFPNAAVKNAITWTVSIISITLSMDWATS